MSTFIRKWHVKEPSDEGYFWGSTRQGNDYKRMYDENNDAYSTNHQTIIFLDQ